VIPRIGQSIRIIAGLALLALSLRSFAGPGFVRWLAGAEVVAAAAFCLPRLWRVGGVALLVILGLAFTHHAIAGQFAASLLFAMLVVCMALIYERS
jgi:hypothetical protein